MTSQAQDIAAYMENPTSIEELHFVITTCKLVVKKRGQGAGDRQTLVKMAADGMFCSTTDLR